MRRHKLVAGKKQAQAMVEFALALPILLLLLYGILEAGRLLFIYSSIVTASRQAVRYGATTGQGLDYSSTPGAPNNTAYQRFEDCYGIRLAAQKADYLNAFEDNDIRIYHDSGPGSTRDEYCEFGENFDTAEFDPSSTNDSRLVVVIEGDFLPIVPGIVPFMRRSADDSPADPIIGESARTLLVSVSIYVTAPPSTWVASGPLATSVAATSAAGTSAVVTSAAATSAAATSAAATASAETAAPTNTATDTPPPTATATGTNTPGGPTDTPTATATATLPPTATATGTVTVIPSTATSTGTAVSQCMQLDTVGTFDKTGNTMTIRIRNQNNYPVTIANVFVIWNADTGHTGTDPTLDLVSVSVGSTVFWNGLIDNASSVMIVPTSAATIPANSNNLALNFNFHQSYDNWDTPATERVTIKFNQPNGCTLNILDRSR